MIKISASIFLLSFICTNLYAEDFPCQISMIKKIEKQQKASENYNPFLDKTLSGRKFVLALLTEANNDPDEYFKPHEEEHNSRELIKAIDHLNKTVNPIRVLRNEQPLSQDEYLKDHPLPPFKRSDVKTPVKIFLSNRMINLARVTYDEVITAIQAVSTKENLCMNDKKPIKLKNFTELVLAKL